jgi:hypothetical protein
MNEWRMVAWRNGLMNGRIDGGMEKGLVEWRDEMMVGVMEGARKVLVAQGRDG